MSRASALVVVLCLAAPCLLAGCRTLGGGTDALQWDPASLSEPAAQQLGASLVRASKDRTAMSGRADFSVDAPDLRFRRPQRIAFERPASLRVEVLALFDQLAAVLTSDGAYYAYFDAAKRKVKRGAVSRELLWRLARIDLSPNEAVSILLGAPAPSAGAELTGVFRGPNGELALEYRGEGHGSGFRFEFDAEGRLSHVQTRGADGGLDWRVAYADYREHDGVQIAHEVALEFPRVAASANFSFDAIELNPALDPAIFQIAPLD